VKEQEAPTGVSPLQVADAIARHAQQRIVGRRGGCFRIGEVSEEAEPEIRLLVAEKAHLQLLGLAPDNLFIDQHHGNDNQRGMVRRDAILEIHPGEFVGRQEGDHQSIDHLKGQIAQRKHGQCAQ
jgi:hypothetical protein